MVQFIIYCAFGFCAFVVGISVIALICAAFGSFCESLQDFYYYIEEKINERKKKAIATRQAQHPES